MSSIKSELIKYFLPTGIGDITPYFAKNLSNLSKMYPGKLAGIIGANLSVEEQQLLSNYLNAASVTL